MKLYLFLIILGFVWFGRAQNNATNATTAAASNATAAAANNTAAAANATAAAANATVANATNATAAAANQTVANATNATVPIVAVPIVTEVEWVEEADFIDQEALLNMLNEADLTTNPILGDSLDFGVEYLDVWGVEEGYLEEGQEYVLDSVNVIQNQQGNETLAFFDVTLKDVNASVINATNATNATGAHSFFVGVYYDSSTTNRSINLSYVIDPLFVSPDGGNFLYQNWTTSYSWSDFNGNRDSSKDIFFFGLNTVLGRAEALGILDSPHYYVERLFAAASSTPNTPPGGTSEQFFVYDAQLSTQALGNVEVIFSVKVQQNVRQLDRWNLFEV